MPITQLVISSKDASTLLAASSDSHFIAEVDRDLPIRAAKLKSVYVPAIYNVESFNQTIQFEEAPAGVPDTVTRTATIVPGMYSASDITGALAAAMTAATGNGFTYLVTYNGITGLVTISEAAAGADTFEIKAASTIFELIGNFNTGFANSHTGTTLLDLAQPKCLHLNIVELGINVATSQRKRGATFILDLPFTTKEAYNITFEKQVYLRKAIINFGSPKQLASMEVFVSRPNGLQVDFRGQEFKFMLDICTCPGEKPPFCCRKC